MIVACYGSNEKMERSKSITKASILRVALTIAKSDGWEALNMRKIAQGSKCSAPVIYDYFENKEAILLAIIQEGYSLLREDVIAAKTNSAGQADQLKHMWLAYWNFAIEQKIYYQLMFAIGINCCQFRQLTEEEDLLYDIFREPIMALTGVEKEAYRIFHTYLSVLHGLISIGLIKKLPGEMAAKILQDIIGSVGETRQ